MLFVPEDFGSALAPHKVMILGRSRHKELEYVLDRFGIAGSDQEPRLQVANLFFPEIAEYEVLQRADRTEVLVR